MDGNLEEGNSNHYIQEGDVEESSSTEEVAQYPILVYRLRITSKDLMESMPGELSISPIPDNSVVIVMAEHQHPPSNGSGQMDLAKIIESTIGSDSMMSPEPASAMDSTDLLDMEEMDIVNDLETDQPPERFVLRSPPISQPLVPLTSPVPCISFQRVDILPNSFTHAEIFPSSIEPNPRMTNEVMVRAVRGKSGGPNRRNRMAPTQPSKPVRPLKSQNHVIRPPPMGLHIPPLMAPPNPWLIKQYMQCGCQVCKSRAFLDPRLTGMAPIGAPRMAFNGNNIMMGRAPAAASNVWIPNGYGAAAHLNQPAFAWDLSRRASQAGNCFPLAQLIPIPPPPRNDTLFPFAFSQGRWIVAQFRCELCGKLEATPWDMHCHRWDHPDEKLKYTEINLSTGRPTMAHECPYIPAVESKLANGKRRA